MIELPPLRRLLLLAVILGFAAGFAVGPFAWDALAALVAAVVAVDFVRALRRGVLGVDVIALLAIVRMADRWALWFLAATLILGCGAWWISGEAIRALAVLERFPLGLNRDSQGTGKDGVLAGDSVSGMRHDQALFSGFAGACG